MKKASAFIAIILVIAVIAGGAFLLTSNPHVKVFSAAKNTVFKSSEYEITVKRTYNDDDSYSETKITLSLGDDIDSSTLLISENSSWDEAAYTSSIKDGKFYNNDGEEYGSVEEAIKDIEDEFEDYLPEDTDLVEEINGIINNKIDEKALEKTYNKVVAPALETLIEEELDETIELPKYDDIFGTATDLFKEDTVKEAIELEKIKSDKPGTTYEYDIDVAELAEAVLNYAAEDKQYREYLEIAADEYDMDVDELVENLADSFDDIDDISGTVTVKSNRITNITVEDGDYSTIEITINSKK